MDNTKTGLFIRELRKEKTMTQKELAELLNITDSAVSKWERGLCAPDIALLEPLAKVFGVTIAELISGARINQEEPVRQTEDSPIKIISCSEQEPAQKAKAHRGKVMIACTVVSIAILICVISAFFPVLFQRGNPVPYLLAAANINDNTPYVRVKVNDPAEIYISRRGICEELLAFVAEEKGFVFQEQAGSTFLFSDGYHALAVQAEIYWRYYTVWSVPNVTYPGKPSDAATN